MAIYPRRASLQGLESEIFQLVSCCATPRQWAEWLRVPLEHAAARGNMNLVTKLFEAGADGGARRRGCHGRTLVDAAAVGGNANVMSALLQRGSRADVNVLSVSSGRSALYTATVLGHEAAARRLILAGADVNFRDPVDQCDVLHKAVEGGHEQLVNDLLIEVSSPDTRDKNDATPLHLAVRQGFEDITSALLVRGADKDALDEEGESPLILAAENGYLDIVNMLLAAGVDVDTRRAHDDHSALDAAAAWGRVDILKAFVTHGMDLNVCDEIGYTALSSAASYGSAKAIDFLIDEGVDVNVVNDEGYAPLHDAARGGRCNAMRALLQRGARVNLRTTDDLETPLHQVCFWAE